MAAVDTPGMSMDVSERNAPSLLSDTGERWLLILVLALGIATPFVAMGRVLADGWEPTGDVATIGLRARDAWTSDAPLVGQPTTGDNYANTESNHPGPIEYWLAGPLIRLAGPRVGLLVAVAAMNAAALFGALWLGWRRGGPMLLSLLAVGLAFLVWALGAASLVDPLNSELAVFPMVLSVVAAWAILDNDRYGLPIFAAAATVTAQTHLAGAAVVLAPTILVVTHLTRAGRRPPLDRRPITIATAIVGLGWFPVVLQELTGRSNVAAIWHTVTAPHARIGITFTLDRLVGALAPVPLFAHRSGSIGFARDVGSALVVAGAAVLGAWSAVLLRGRASRGAGRSWRFGLTIAVTLLVTSFVWSGNPPSAAFRADGARWLWVLPLLLWVSLAWSLVLRAPRSARPWIRAWALPLGAVIAVLLLTGALAQPHLAARRDGAVMAATRELADQVHANVRRGTYRVVLDGPLSSFTVGPGVVYLLEADGFHTTFDRSVLTAGFGDHRIEPDAVVDGTLLISSASATDEPGREVASVTITAKGAEPVDLRVILR